MVLPDQIIKYPIKIPNRLRIISSTSKLPSLVKNWKISTNRINQNPINKAFTREVALWEIIGNKKPNGIKGIIFPRRLNIAQPSEKWFSCTPILLNGIKL